MEVSAPQGDADCDINIAQRARAALLAIHARLMPAGTPKSATAYETLCLLAKRYPNSLSGSRALDSVPGQRELAPEQPYAAPPAQLQAPQGSDVASQSGHSGNSGDPYNPPTDSSRRFVYPGYQLGFCAEAVDRWNELCTPGEELLLEVDVTTPQQDVDGNIRIAQRARTALMTLHSQLMPQGTPKSRTAQEVLCPLAQRYPDSLSTMGDLTKVPGHAPDARSAAVKASRQLDDETLQAKAVWGNRLGLFLLARSATVPKRTLLLRETTTATSRTNCARHVSLLC